MILKNTLKTGNVLPAVVNFVYNYIVSSVFVAFSFGFVGIY